MHRITLSSVFQFILIHLTEFKNGIKYDPRINPLSEMVSNMKEKANYCR